MGNLRKYDVISGTQLFLEVVGSGGEDDPVRADLPVFADQGNVRVGIPYCPKAFSDIKIC